MKLTTWLRGAVFVCGVAVAVPLAGQTPAPANAAARWADVSRHAARRVRVAPGVSLEVLDWGGSGAPLVFLAGGGHTAHG